MVHDGDGGWPKEIADPVHAFVRLLLPDGAEHTLAPGDLIGRLETAALSLSDARISEAHALVSLRGEELRLLGLRGRFAVDRTPMKEVVLRPGMTVEFAPGLSVRVVEVSLPDEVLALEGDGLPRQVLSGVCSLHLRPEPRIAHRYEAGAAAHIWTSGGSWTLQLEGAAPAPLEAGDEFTIDGISFAAVPVSLLEAASPATRAGGVRPPLTIEARFDTVHIHQDGVPALSLSGIAARIISELVAFDGPVHWQTIASEIWKEETQKLLLRRKWDVSLARLRRKLKDAGLPPGLLRAARTGHAELALELGDTVVDRT